MRYRLENGSPVLITKVTVDGLTTTNPSDAFIDEHELGYPKLETEAPEYDPETERISFAWEVVQDADPVYGVVIMKVWTVTELTEEELRAKRNAAIDAQIAEVNSAYDQWQLTPVEYAFNNQTMYLKPIWITQYYGTLQQVSLMTSGAIFPMIITDTAGVNFEMTAEEFQTMYLWLVQVASTEIARVNAVLAELEADKEVVNA